ncbi:MAG: hypothetical protein M1813_001300 [Trichoglossum hirsutum]|nr:MAG: hypothetical protein M1813_001300 [Trichoglossum hirsutum]
MAQSGSGNHGSRLQKPLHQAPLISISPAISGPETQHNPQQDNPAVRTDNSTIRVDGMTNRDDYINTAERETGGSDKVADGVSLVNVAPKAGKWSGRMDATTLLHGGVASTGRDRQARRGPSQNTREPNGHGRENKLSGMGEPFQGYSAGRHEA